jgi:hypothetical protein
MVLIVNDKIESLLYRSGLTSQGCWDKLDEWDREAVLKFGELIVRNCIDEMITQMWHHGIDESNNPSFYKAVERTKQHFGVK